MKAYIKDGYVWMPYVVKWRLPRINPGDFKMRKEIADRYKNVKLRTDYYGTVNIGDLNA